MFEHNQSRLGWCQGSYFLPTNQRWACLLNTKLHAKICCLINQYIYLSCIPEIKNLDQFSIKLSSFKNKSKIHLKSKFIELWRDQMLQQTNGKLRTYITFKSNFGREKYLSVLKVLSRGDALHSYVFPVINWKLRLVDTKVLSYKIENVSWGSGRRISFSISL